MPPIDDLPGELTTTTRDAERDRVLRDYSFHKPDDNTSPGTEPFLFASTLADAVMPLYHDIKLCADATDPTKVSGKELKVRAEADGVVRNDAIGGSGSVMIGASVGGGTIFAGDEITAKNLRFKCNATALYNDGDSVPVIGLDSGPATNLDHGTVMKWSSPRPGIVQNATVIAQADGSGLSGGRNQETEDEYRDRWNQEKRNRAASGNDAEIQELVEKTFGIPVEKCFTHPGILGPGTNCFVFTIQAGTNVASRIPNPTQIAACLANVTQPLPADDGIFAATIVAQPVDIVAKVRWLDGAAGWSDLVTWPEFYANPGQAVLVSSVTDALHFILKTQNANYSGVAAPIAGRRIAFYDQAEATFRQKTILSVTGTGPWTIVCDASNGASDETYTPVVNQRVSPWSDSLQNLVGPLGSYFKTLGPGEQVASFFDEGTRQKREPQSPKAWPSVLTTTGLEGAMDIASVFDAAIAEPALPKATTVGTPGVTSYLIELGEIAAFPL